LRHTLLFSLPGLMLFIIPVEGASLRLSWQLGAIWLAAGAFTLFLSSWWLRLFWLLALGQIIFGGRVLTSYITLMMIAIFLSACEGFSRIRPRRVLPWIGAGGAVLSIWIALQALGAVPKWRPAEVAAGPFNIDAASVMLALCLPAFFIRPWGWAALGIGAALAACRATTGFVAALAAGAVWLLLSDLPRVRKLQIAAGAAAVCVAFFTFVDPIGTTLNERRWTAWKYSVLTFLSDWNGRGLGSYAQIFPYFAANDEVFTGKGKHAWVQAHNEYLQTGFEMGLQATALLLAYVAAFGAWLWGMRKRMTEDRRRIAAGMTALVVSCLGWHTFHIAPLALVGVAWIGLWEREKRKMRGVSYEGRAMGPRWGLKCDCGPNQGL
jgi:hypothetical protein